MIRRRGFTLIELIIVITLTGIVVAMIGPLLVRPFSLVTDQERRARLLERAQAAITLIQREVRQALPNSVRVNGTALELVPVLFAGRYPYGDDPANIDTLTPRKLDGNFSVMADFTLPNGTRAVVNPYNTALLYSAMADAYNGMVTPSTITVTVADNGMQDRITLSSPFRFDPSGNGSPSRRVFFVNTPVSYLCEGNELRRFASYSAAVAQPTSSSSAPLNTAGSQALVTDGVTFCQFRYAVGVAQRSGLLTIELELSEDGEAVRLIGQVHVENVP